MSERTRLGSDPCPPPWREDRVPAELEELAALVRDVRFRPGWSFHLISYGSETVLAVELETVDTYSDPPRPVRIGHKFKVPPIKARRAWWRSWLLERIADVDQHEACEWFLERVVREIPTVDLCSAPEFYGSNRTREEWVRPFDPHHDPGQAAYRVIDRLGDAAPR